MVVSFLVMIAKDFSKTLTPGREKTDLKLIFLIIYTLRKFNAVVKACFINTLDPTYDVKIDQFKNSYLSLTKVRPC